MDEKETALRIFQTCVKLSELDDKLYEIFKCGDFYDISAAISDMADLIVDLLGMDEFVGGTKKMDDFYGIIVDTKKESDIESAYQKLLDLAKG